MQLSIHDLAAFKRLINNGATLVVKLTTGSEVHIRTFVCIEVLEEFPDDPIIRYSHLRQTSEEFQLNRQSNQTLPSIRLCGAESLHLIMPGD